MNFSLRLLCNFLGGMLAATGLVLVYVYLLGAPDLPRLPIIGLPHTFIALLLLLAWALAQGYVSLLGAVIDGLLALFGLRAPPGARMAFGHGFAVTVGLLLMAWHFRPDALSAEVALFAPAGLSAAVRLVAGRLPDEKTRKK